MAKRGFTFIISSTAEEMVQTHFPSNEIRQALVMYVSPDKTPDGQPTIAVVWDDEEDAVEPAAPPTPTPQVETITLPKPKLWVPGGR